MSGPRTVLRFPLQDLAVPPVPQPGGLLEAAESPRPTPRPAPTPPGGGTEGVTAAILIGRFRAKVVETPSCHFWIGGLGDDGYGRFALPGRRTVRAHLWLYQQVASPIPAGRVLLHSCDESSCVNLAHLSVGTRAQNQAEMAHRGRAAGGRASGRGDTRGPHGRSLAIRGALFGGFNVERLAAVMADGDPDRDQYHLFDPSTIEETP